MKIYFTANGKLRGKGTFMSVVDFFFPFGKEILRKEATTMNHEGKISRSFFTFRSFFRHCAFAWITYLKRDYKEFWESQGFTTSQLKRIGAIAYDTTDGNRIEASSNTISVTHTASGSNRAASVFSSHVGSYSSSATYDGTGFGAIEAQVTPSTGYNEDVRTLIAPSTTAGATVTTNWGGNGSGRVIIVETFSGANQTDCSGGTGTVDAGSTSPATANITTTTANSIVSFYIHGGDTAGTLVADGGATQTYLSNSGVNHDDASAAYIAVAAIGATSVAFSWVLGGSYMGVVAVEMIAAGGGAPTRVIKGHGFSR